MEIWRHTSAHLSGNRKKKADVPQNKDAMDLSIAISAVLDEESVYALYPYVHRAVFITGTLPLPLNGGCAVEDTLLASCRILLCNLPREFHDICPLPSSLVIRLIWSKLVSSEMKLHQKANANANANTGETLPDAVDMVVSSITADSGYLAYFMRQAIEAQALFEHFSHVFGYTDSDL